ncbi:pyridoxal phosphate-dependent aminotransferase [Phaeobacter marinintestinus]|uniref:pyridoxal phosphate-dependent aminotransferase n=1 Tax=Falsiphaeobacter marinintestinus TaxID=1492905 RepID=UPI0011B60AB3|nr:pyridoxal phosphate-dependent aminotransferase [Phaeobacter marinintestinus]
MPVYTASQLSKVQPSASAAISQKARAMRAAGEDVIDLGLGEPDFDTPPHIVEAAHRAAQGGQTRYPPTSGTSALKQAIQAKFQHDNGLIFAADQIIVSNGAKQVIFDALMATLEPGDEVILAAPYFDSYRNIISLLGGVRRVVQTHPDDQFLLRPEDLEAAITDKTRWLILNAPSNPAGASYSHADLQALGQVLARHPQVLILSDEIYEHILFDGHTHVAFAAACPDLADRILTVNGVSKAYAMTGWRIGYGAGPKGLIDAMTTVQSQISSGACSVAQAAATEALTGPQDCVMTFRTAFERRRNLVVDAIATTPGLSLIRPKGAFYALIDCSDLIGPASGLQNDVQVVEHLLTHAKIAAVPGSVYDMPGHFRISTACADDTLTTAMNRIATASETALNGKATN